MCKGRPVDRFALCDGSQCGQLADEPGVIVLFASKYVKIITGMKVHDATAGFVCYTRKVLETINLDKIRFKGYAFQIEMKFTASTLKFRLQEVPIILQTVH